MKATLSALVRRKKNEEGKMIWRLEGWKDGRMGSVSGVCLGVVLEVGLEG